MSATVEAGAEVTQKTAAEHGLTADEYARLLRIMGRTPNLTELGIFSVMWSEHCSYKSSRKWLKRLPTEGPQVIQGPGENAGVVDIGHGLAAIFKIESHNHPSFIEPYQGAATGVGGIMRDVFTMGARPIANLNELEYVNGEIWANVWQTFRIARISPQTGQVLGWIDFSGIMKESTDVDVMNGIAYDAKRDRLFVTGKLWPKIFEVKIVPR